MAPVVRALRRRPWAATRLLATGQHRELAATLLARFELVPDRDLAVMRPDQSLADLEARLAATLPDALAAERPDLVLAQGDTTSVVATARACRDAGIPFAHVEAGLRTGDLADPFPEEGNRVEVGQLATLHFAPTAQARDNLLREGVPAAAVHVTGNPVVDALELVRPHLPPPPFAAAPGRHLLLVTAHRRESFGAPFAALCRALRTLAARADVDIVFPVHPNPNVHDVAHRELAGVDALRLVPPLDYFAMLATMRAARVVLSDSGGVQEEAPSLGVPVLVLRNKTERPEGVAAGIARLVGMDHDTIVGAVHTLLDDPKALAAMTPTTNPYGDGKAGERIADLVAAFVRGDA